MSEITVSEIVDIWHYSFTVDVQGGGEDEYKVQYFGPELINVFGADYTGEPLGDALRDSLKLANTIGFYPKVIKARVPVSESSSFYLEGREVRYRSLIVPLSSDGRTIDYLFGTTNYKVCG